MLTRLTRGRALFVVPRGVVMVALREDGAEGERAATTTEAYTVRTKDIRRVTRRTDGRIDITFIGRAGAHLYLITVDAACVFPV